MTQTAPMTLADFLLARIAEDEAAAQEAAIGPFSGLNWEIRHADHEGIYIAPIGYGDPEEITPVTTHMERCDPARVLAECEAKRRIVKTALAAVEQEKLAVRRDSVSSTPRRALCQGRTEGWWGAVRLLAEAYADHADYRELWRI